MCGNNSLTGMPLSPRGSNSQGLAMMLPLALNMVGRTGTGIGLPWSVLSRGLGSKLSTCDTPPDMKQKITLRTRGANCLPPGSPASGLPRTAPAPPAPASLAPTSPRAHNPPSAVHPNPIDARVKNSRRLVGRLFDIQELLQAKEGMRQILPGFQFRRTGGLGLCVV